MPQSRLQTPLYCRLLYGGKTEPHSAQMIILFEVLTRLQVAEAGIWVSQNASAFWQVA